MKSTLSKAGGILTACTIFLCLSSVPLTRVTRAATNSSATEHRLHLYHTHTGEHIDIVYRRGDAYLPEAEIQLVRFLLARRPGTVKHSGPHVFSILADRAEAAGHPGGEIAIIC